MKDISIRSRLIFGFTFSIFVTAISCIIGILAINNLTGEDSGGSFWQNGASMVLVVCLILGVVVSTLVEVIVIGGIKTSLHELSQVSENIARGNTDIDFKDLGNNEFGEIMGFFRECADGLSSNARVASEIANYNLTVDVAPCSDKDLLGNALKKLVKDNNDVMSMIKRASLEVNTGAGQVAAASQSLAQGSTEQASAIEQVTASIRDIAAKTKDNASQANEANKLVHMASEDAADGNRRMTEMKTAMKEINDSSENISKIIKVIDDIAFQTNILALNAAVEAARAGSYGKGFAVVAEEVRNLASKSSQAATETAAMIEDSIDKVHAGSTLADETAAALANIVEQVQKIVDITSNIAIASNNQATALAQVDQAIEQVSQVVQTNSATSEECAAASEQLSGQATNLLGTIERFKLKGNAYNDYGYSGNSLISGNNMSSFGSDDEIKLSADFGKY